MSFPKSFGPIGVDLVEKWQRDHPLWSDIVTPQELINLVRYRLKKIREENIAAHKEKILGLLNSGVDPESLGLVMEPDTETDAEFYRRHFSVRGVEG